MKKLALLLAVGALLAFGAAQTMTGGMTGALAEADCVACRKGAAPLADAEVSALLAGLPGWSLAADGRAIERRFGFADFAGAFDFVARIAAIAEAQGHHPDLGLGWGYVTVRLQTHVIDGLHRNDFIMAARIDRLTTG